MELNLGSLELPEEILLRYIRLIKNEGLKAKPQFAVKFNKADTTPTYARACGVDVVPISQASGMSLVLADVLMLMLVS